MQCARGAHAVFTQCKVFQCNVFHVYDYQSPSVTRCPQATFFWGGGGGQKVSSSLLCGGYRKGVWWLLICSANAVDMSLLCSHVQQRRGGGYHKLCSLPFFTLFHPIFTHLQPVMCFGGGEQIIMTGNHLTSSTFTMQRPWKTTVSMHATSDMWV